jgi:hypothetical protein
LEGWGWERVGMAQRALGRAGFWMKGSGTRLVGWDGEVRDREGFMGLGCVEWRRVGWRMGKKTKRGDGKRPNNHVAQS